MLVNIPVHLNSRSSRPSTLKEWSLRQTRSGSPQSLPSAGTSRTPRLLYEDGTRTLNDHCMVRPARQLRRIDRPGL